MKNDWSTFTRLNDNDVVDGWLKIGNEVYIYYCKTKDLKELTQKVLNAARYTRWIYIIVHDEGDNDGHIGGRLHVKIGECTTDFLNRYGNITGNTYNHRVIEVFPSNVSDKDIHPNLKKNPIKGVRSDEFTRYANGSEEIYEVTDVESLAKLISETHRLAEKTVECVERKEMRLYNDTSYLGDKIVIQCKDFYDKTNGGSPHIICNLCCRFGKAKMYDEIKKRIAGHVKSVKIENLNNDFNIGMNVPLSITTIDFSKDYPTIDFVCCGKQRVVRSIYDCNLIGDYKTIWSILDKIRSKMKEIGGDMMNKHTTKEKKGASLYLKYSDIVSAPMGAYGSSAEAMMDLPCFMIETGLGKFASTYISGGFSQVDSTLYPDVPFAKKRGASKQLSDHPATCVYGTKQELENWKHFIFNNKLPLFINIVPTIDQHNNSKEFLPWLVDKQYTDGEIYAKFNLTPDEIALIDATLKKFERNSPWFKRYMCVPAADSTTKNLEADVANLIQGA